MAASQFWPSWSSPSPTFTHTRGTRWRPGRGVALEPVAPQRQRHADADGQPLPERAGAHLDAGDVVPVRVTLEVAARVAEGPELRARDEAPVGELGVEEGRAVPVRQDEAVAVGVLGLLRIEPHLVEEEVRQVVRRRRGGPRRAPRRPRASSSGRRGGSGGRSRRAPGTSSYRWRARRRPPGPRSCVMKARGGIAPQAGANGRPGGRMPPFVRDGLPRGATSEESPGSTGQGGG